MKIVSMVVYILNIIYTIVDTRLEINFKQNLSLDL
jgi:hypothetical protein